MKSNCTLEDFQANDMVVLKKGWTMAQGIYGFVIQVNPDICRVEVRHGDGEIKQYRPEELKNVTGGNP